MDGKPIVCTVPHFSNDFRQVLCYLKEDNIYLVWICTSHAHACKIWDAFPFN